MGPNQFMLQTPVLLKLFVDLAQLEYFILERLGKGVLILQDTFVFGDVGGVLGNGLRQVVLCFQLFRLLLEKFGKVFLAPNLFRLKELPVLFPVAKDTHESLTKALHFTKEFRHVIAENTCRNASSVKEIRQ